MIKYTMLVILLFQIVMILFFRHQKSYYCVGITIIISLTTLLIIIFLDSPLLRYSQFKDVQLPRKRFEHIKENVAKVWNLIYTHPLILPPPGLEPYRDEDGILIKNLLPDSDSLSSSSLSSQRSNLSIEDKEKK